MSGVVLAVTEALGVLKPIARIIDRKHSRKYYEEVLELEQMYQEEANKESLGEMVNHAKLDVINQRLSGLFKIFGPSLEKSNPKTE